MKTQSPQWGFSSLVQRLCVGLEVQDLMEQSSAGLMLPIPILSPSHSDQSISPCSNTTVLTAGQGLASLLSVSQALHRLVLAQCQSGFSRCVLWHRIGLLHIYAPFKNTELELRRYLPVEHDFIIRSACWEQKSYTFLGSSSICPRIICMKTSALATNKLSPLIKEIASCCSHQNHLMQFRRCSVNY